MVLRIVSRLSYFESLSLDGAIYGMHMGIQSVCDLVMLTVCIKSYLSKEICRSDTCSMVSTVAPSQRSQELRDHLISAISDHTYPYLEGRTP